MSDIGILSQDYQTSADIFRTLNHAVILLKKRFYHLAGDSQITEQDLRNAKRSLSGFVNSLVSSLEATGEGEEIDGEDNPVPSFLVHRIREKHKANLSWYVDDLRELLRLLDYEPSLTEDQIHQLDELCEQVDAETTALHRKLWRK